MKNIIVLIFLLTFSLTGQSQDRFDSIQIELNRIADESNPGLRNSVKYSVSGVSIQEFFRGFARVNDLNISVDSRLNILVTNNLTNASAIDVILHILKQHDLDVDITGSIIHIRQFEPPVPKPVPIKPKEIVILFDGSINTLSYDLNNDSLINVVKKISYETGMNVGISPLLLNKQVYGYINSMKVEEALAFLAESNNLILNNPSPNIFFYEPKSPSEQIASQLASNKANDGLSYEVTIQEGIKYVQLEANNFPLSEIIRIISKEVDADYFLFNEIQGNISAYINNASYNELLSHLLMGTNYTYNLNNGAYLIGERNREGLRLTKVIQLQFRSADTVAALIPLEIKRGVDIKTLAELNSLILSGSGPQIFEIEHFIKAIDQLVPVIYIELFIIDVNKGRTVSTGIAAGVSDSVSSGGTILPGVDITLSGELINNLLDVLNGGGTVNLGNVSREFYVSLRALEINDNISIRSTPKLSTLNGHNAQMSIGRTEYYLQQSTQIYTGTTPTTQVREQYQAVTAEFALNIRPVVSGDNHVTLTVHVEMSDFTGRSEPNAPPGQASREFKSMIRVKDGDMIVLGGLEDEQKIQSTTGLPILSRIPILKKLFSQDTESKSESKLLIFIKPTILY